MRKTILSALAAGVALTAPFVHAEEATGRVEKISATEVTLMSGESFVIPAGVAVEPGIKREDPVKIMFDMKDGKRVVSELISESK